VTGGRPGRGWWGRLEEMTEGKGCLDKTDDVRISNCSSGGTHGCPGKGQPEVGFCLEKPRVGRKEEGSATELSRGSCVCL
jgi:hypothetical protein